MIRLKEISPAVELLERSEQAAATITTAYRKSIIYRKIASEYMTLKNMNRAKLLLDNIASVYSANV